MDLSFYLISPSTLSTKSNHNHRKFLLLRLYMKPICQRWFPAVVLDRRQMINLSSSPMWLWNDYNLLWLLYTHEQIWQESAWITEPTLKNKSNVQSRPWGTESNDRWWTRYVNIKFCMYKLYNSTLLTSAIVFAAQIGQNRGICIKKGEINLSSF